LILDLDAEMIRRGLGGIVGYGETSLADPDLTYLVGAPLARGGFYFKAPGREPLLVVGNVDYGSAKRNSRVKRIETLTQWRYEGLLRKHRERNEANAHLIASVLRNEKIRGKVVLLGRNDLAKGLWMARTLNRLGVQLAGERTATVLEAVRDTKDQREIENIREAAKKTAKVVNGIIGVLRNARENRGHLHVGKRRATVGLLKSMIASRLARQGLATPEGTIFAAGPSSADPHNLGFPSQEIKKGKLIVFDIFPQAESGYWVDLTRTFVVGKASPRARKMFETVLAAQANALDYLRAGSTGDAAMHRVCNIIEQAGFRTVKQLYRHEGRAVSSGFIHSLGHGVGLTIGESPYLSFGSKERLKQGEVVTVEPGVYMPHYGGVRIEDTVVIKSKGIENLAYVEKGLEIT
jgi:Xaa-Pro aminopeptidase